MLKTLLNVLNLFTKVTSKQENKWINFGKGYNGVSSDQDNMTKQHRGDKKKSSWQVVNDIYDNHMLYIYTIIRCFDFIHNNQHRKHQGGKFSYTNITNFISS